MKLLELSVRFPAWSLGYRTSRSMNCSMIDRMKNNICNYLYSKLDSVLSSDNSKTDCYKRRKPGILFREKRCLISETELVTRALSQYISYQRPRHKMFYKIQSDDVFPVPNICKRNTFIVTTL